MRTAGPPVRLASRLPSFSDGSPAQPLTGGCVRLNLAASSAARHFLQIVFCIVSVVLGTRVSQEISQVAVLLQFRGGEDAVNWFDRHSQRYFEDFIAIKDHDLPGFSGPVMVNVTALDGAVPHPGARLLEANTSTEGSNGTSSGIQVGRHRILIREWPHPDPTEVMRAYGLIARVQQEQRRLHGVQDWKPVIAITPTYARMFQALHLTGLMHTLSLIRGPVTWIVIEAGGVSKGTEDLLIQARELHNVVHLGYPKSMPAGFEARWILESHMRLEGLRFVRERKLEGVVVFADDSNVHSLEFFNLVQKVKWVGALPVGILGLAGFQDASINPKRKRKRRGSLLLGVVHSGQTPPEIPLQVQGLARNVSNGALDGWRAHRPLPLDWDSGKGTPLLDHSLQWAGFVMNARAVWAPQAERPLWIRDWQVWATVKDYEYLDLRSIFKDESHVEDLAGNEHDQYNVRQWWIRMEGHHDCKFPPRWALDSQPEIVLRARRTPWPVEAPNTFPSPAFSSSQSKESISGNNSTAGEGQS